MIHDHHQPILVECSALHLLFHLNLYHSHITPSSRYNYCSYFLDEETKAQWDAITWPWSHGQKVPEHRFEPVSVLPMNCHLKNSFFKSWINTHAEKYSIYEHKFQWLITNICVGTNQIKEEKMSSTPEIPCAPSQLHRSSSSEMPSFWLPTSSWVCLHPNIM